MKRNIQTEIIIRSTPEKVYDILTDLEGFAEWNPFIIHSEGTVREGARIFNTLLNGNKPIKFKPRVLKAERGVAFEWLGHLRFKGIFDGHHYFHIENLGDGTVKLTHGENFSGLFSALILRQIGKGTMENFIAMNRALKQKCEGN